MEMSSSSENTYIFDPENAAEMARLIEQARLATKGMGGPLTGLPKLSAGAKVVDLCCGPGGWVLDVACERPDVEVVGVDISRIMIEYANACARSQKITNASFRVMNITQPFDFSDHSFDLVNARFLTGVLKRDAWKPFINECTRILRPGGILRLTEGNEFAITLSPAYEELTAMILQATWRMGYGFSSNGRTWAMSAALPYLLRQAGYQEIQIISYMTDCSAHTEYWAGYYHDIESMFLQVKPLLLAMGLVTEEAFEQLYRQTMIEVNSNDFSCVSHAASVWGYAPGK
ncbi:MAG TPA: class I SAM-dependent methyltransferase [Ktedonobacteraceae bacterium]|nr:class I SAM-dependent methyltransferase [Ktedonobacteraceae bacterium]